MSYTTIPTIGRDSLKTFVTDSIINPLVGQHNTLTTEFVEVSDKVTALEAIPQVTTFKQLADTPDSFDTLAGKMLVVNADESGLEFVDAVEAPASGAPTKWYILPLAGQSNMWGCGEQPWPIDDPDPRLMQLATANSYEQTADENKTDQRNAGPEITPYGARYREFRPMEESNLQLIPAVPGLDSAQNGFHIGFYSPVSGGTPVRTFKYANTSAGYFIAKAILPYIPKDYGIIIVNCSRGGGGITSSAGTYDEATMLPSLNGNGHGVGHPFNRMLKDRVKHALGLNPDNKLLPLIWCQGESDPDSDTHRSAFKNLVLDYKQHLLDHDLETRLPFGTINNLKVIAIGTTKVIFGEDIGLSHIDANPSYTSFKYTYRGRYDNYAFFMDDPDLMHPETKESIVSFLRMDVGEDGEYLETALEENRANGTLKIFSSALDTHFSSTVLKTKFPDFVVNAIAKSRTGYLIGCPHRMWTRPIPGRTGVVTTDNVTYVYPKELDMNFDPDKDLLFNRCFVTGTSYTATGTSITSDNAVIETDGENDVAVYTGEGDRSTVIKNDTNPSAGCKTVSIMFQLDESSRYSTTTPLASISDSEPEGPVIKIKHGQLWVWNKMQSGIAVSLNKSLLGAWKGGWADWQHLTLVHSFQLGITHFYLNGCHVMSHKFPSIAFRDFRIGQYGASTDRFIGKIRTVRLYDRALSSAEVATLEMIDRNATTSVVPTP